MFASSFRKNKTQSSTPFSNFYQGWRKRPEQTAGQRFTDLQIEFPKTAMAGNLEQEDERPEEIVEASHEILNTFAQWTKTLSLDELLARFDIFFINHDPVQVPAELNPHIYQLLTYNCTAEFIYLINRCSFSVVNLCLRQKKTKYIKKGACSVT